MADIELGSVVIDVNDLAGMRRFWQEALGYECVVDRDHWAKLIHPGGGGTTVSLQKVPEPRAGKNRLHIDLYSKDVTGAVARLTELGARVFPRKPEEGEDFVVLQDPEGNLFCIIDRDATGNAG